METFSLSRKEIPRVGLLKAAIQGKITNAEAAAALGLSVRQFQRLKIRFSDGGLGALQHRTRGRPSPHKAAEEQRTVARLLQTTYSGFNDCHVTEKLKEIEKVAVSREFVRRVRLSLGLPAKRKRRAPRHRIRRLREAREGSLVQTDGSFHDWLEGRGPSMCLVGVVDDATGKILAGTFRPREDLHGYATVFHQMFTRYGLPLAIYGDGTNILVRNDEHWTLAEELQGTRSPTQLGRTLKDLGIRYIRAYSPQAKGRVENRWAVLQDRLVSELRLRGISSLDAANAYLPEFFADFNLRFGKTPRDLTTVWRRPPRDLDAIVSCRYFRIVSRDNVISLGGHHKDDLYRGALGTDLHQRTELPVVQIPRGPGGRSWAGYKVEARELLDGRIMVFYRGTLLISTSAPDKDFVLASRKSTRRFKNEEPILRKPARKATGRPRRNGATCPPDSSHPWKRKAVTPRAEG